MRGSLKPELVLLESGTTDPAEFVRLGISCAQHEDYERGLIYLAEAYKRIVGTQAVKESKLPPNALSTYGLCLALHKGRVKEAAEFCTVAIEMEFFNAEHYMNLARVWMAGKARRKALEAIDRGLGVEPRHSGLHRLRVSFGLRKRPVVPFLPRDNPVNVALGKVRQSLKEPKKR